MAIAIRRLKVSEMDEGDADQLEGKLVRVRLERGIAKVHVGVFSEADSESIRIWELYTRGRFRLQVYPRAQIAAVHTLDLKTGRWPDSTE